MTAPSKTDPWSGAYLPTRTLAAFTFELRWLTAKNSKSRLQRVMKAQEKAGPPDGQSPVKDEKANGATGRGARPTKKRKIDFEETIKSEGEDDDGEDARQLHQSLNGIDEEGEKV